MRRVQLLLPTVAAGLTRVLQLVLLVVLVRLSSGETANLLVTGFALLSAFAIITDSGASNFLLSLPRASLTRRVHAKTIGFHAVLAMLGAGVAVILTFAAVDFRMAVSTASILCALGFSQVLDSLTRTIRAPLLVGARDATYAIPDLLLLVLKMVPVAAAVALSQLDVLLFLPAASLLVVVVTWLFVRRSLPAEHGADSRIFPRIFEFGLSGSLSALYSQAPLVIGTAILGVAVAPLALAYRVAQPLEVLPATLSQQLIPRIRVSARPPHVYWASFFGLGLALAVALALGRDYVAAIFGGGSLNGVIFLLVLASVAPKFGNYGLIAFTMGAGLIRVRLIATIAVGVFAVILTVSASFMFGAQGLAAVTLISELFMTILIVTLIKRRRERLAR